jgi:hypothetical protein
LGRDYQPWAFTSTAIGAAATNFSGNWLRCGSVIRFRTKVPDLNTWPYHHESALALISDHHLDSWKDRSQNHSHDTNQLICHCRAPPMNKMSFQYRRWCESAVISHSIRIYKKGHSKDLLRFLNRLAVHGLFALMSRIWSRGCHRLSLVGPCH